MTSELPKETSTEAERSAQFAAAQRRFDQAAAALAASEGKVDEAMLEEDSMEVDMTFSIEKLKRLGTVREIERVAEGEPMTVTLQGGSSSNAVAAAVSLARRHLPLREAKDVAERAFDGAEVTVMLPLVENIARLEGELADAGFALKQEDDVRARKDRIVRELAEMDEVDYQPPIRS